MILSIGELLLDIYPEGKHIGGAPFNFYFHLHALGLPAIFFSRVGSDENGEWILNFFDRHHLSKEYIQVDSSHATGHVLVQLNNEGSPSFDIVQHTAYDFLDFQGAVTSLAPEEIELIYFGTLIQRTSCGRNTLMKLLENKHPETPCLCDLNLRPDCYTPHIIEKSLAACNILKINEDELATIKKVFSLKGDDEHVIGHLMHTHAIEWVCLTMGEKGSCLFTGNSCFFDHPPTKRVNIVDTVGAGDAYTAILAAGYIDHWDPALILKRASEFAVSVCGINGAIPDTTTFYQPFLKWTTHT